MSVAQLQEIPPKNMVLLVGPPGSGKSTFCHRTVLNNLATGRSVIFVTTEHAPSDVTRFLREHACIEYCKVGKVSMDETTRMKENCESFGIEGEQPTCFFTTGFLNGFFSAVKNQHVKEKRCIAMGDPYCEWEFR